jgi:hypothetical protein
VPSLCYSRRDLKFKFQAHAHAHILCYIAEALLILLFLHFHFDFNVSAQGGATAGHAATPTRTVYLFLLFFFFFFFFFFFSAPTEAPNRRELQRPGPGRPCRAAVGLGKGPAASSGRILQSLWRRKAPTFLFLFLFLFDRTGVVNERATTTTTTTTRRTTTTEETQWFVACSGRRYSTQPAGWISTATYESCLGCAAEVVPSERGRSEHAGT